MHVISIAPGLKRKTLGYSNKKSDDRLTFRQSMVAVAEGIGLHHLPVRHDAGDIHEFLQDDAVHHDLMRRTVREIYKANGCSHLDATIQHDVTLRALGIIRGTLIRSLTTDVDQLDLFDKFSTQLVNLFDKYVLQPEKFNVTSGGRHSAAVLTPSTRYWHAQPRPASVKD